YEVDRPLPVPGGPSVTRPASSYMVLVQAVLGCRGDLHQHGITHGDLKPDNLLLDEPSGRLKITDFGSSRRLTDNLIRTTRHAGAWAYQAPEIQQANQRGAISDLFSVGAVMYHAATGRLPRASIQALLTSAPITRPRQFNPAIPAALDDLVMQLLVDDPAHRLPNANELR